MRWSLEIRKIQISHYTAHKKAALIEMRLVVPWNVAFECFVLLRKVIRAQVDYTDMIIRQDK